MQLLWLYFGLIISAIALRTDSHKIEDDGIVEVEDDPDTENVMQKGDRIPTEKELHWIYTREFGHSKEAWLKKRRQYDLNKNGRLENEELHQLALEFFTMDYSNLSVWERLYDQKEWVAAYLITGLAAVYMLYSMCCGSHTQHAKPLHHRRVPPRSRLLQQTSQRDSSQPKVQYSSKTCDSANDKDNKKQPSDVQLNKNNEGKSHEASIDNKDNSKCDQLPKPYKNEFKASTPQDPRTSNGVNSEKPVAPPKSYESKPKKTSPTIKAKERTVFIQEILSSVLDVSVVVQEAGKPLKWSTKELSIRPSELPVKSEEISLKCHVLWEKRLSREVLPEKKLTLCIFCYNKCTEWMEGKSVSEHFEAVLATLRSCAFKETINLLNSKDDVNDEDDFWSALASSSSSTVSATQPLQMEFLLKLSGYYHENHTVSPRMLRQIFEHGKANTEIYASLCHLMYSAGTALKKVSRHDEISLEHAKTLKGLEVVLVMPEMQDIIVEGFKEDVLAASTSLGVYYEQQSCIGPLLAVSPVPAGLKDIINLKSSVNSPWLTMKGFPNPSRYEVNSIETQVSSGLHTIQSIVFKLFKALAKRHREPMLAWLASVASMNELRTSFQPAMNPNEPQAPPTTCSDGFMLNILPVLLDLCMPFCQGNDLDKLSKVAATYCSSSACRINYDLETCLAGGQIVSEEDEHHVVGELPEALKGTHNFMTEIFHVTLRMLNIGFFPALFHFNKIQRGLVSSLKRLDKESPVAADLRAKHMVFALRWDVCLLDTEFIQKATHFYLAVSKWLLLQLNSCGKNGFEERQIFSQIPEYIVKDLGQWFWFLASHALRVHPNVVASMDLYPMVDCCVLLLRRPDLMPGPLPAFRLTQALLAFVKSGQQSSQNTHMRSEWGSGTLSGLASTVHTCPAVQSDLGPALIHTYTTVDVVEGLDVDKEEFDKYAARGEIGNLIDNLWARADCRKSILDLCDTSEFQRFLSAILDTLLYQLHDSLSRLANVKTLQAAQADETQWRQLSLSEKDEKTKFLHNEEQVAGSFMRMARSTLDLLDMMTQSEEVPGVFSHPSLARRSSSAFLGFLEALCGHKATDLKVKDMDKYNFDPKQLLHQIVGVLLRLASCEAKEGKRLIECMASDPELNQSTMMKALSVIRDRIMDGDMAQSFERLTDQLLLLRAEQTASTSQDSNDATQDIRSQYSSINIDEEVLQKDYLNHLTGLRFDTATLLVHHSFQTNAAAQTVDPRSAKCKALMKEVKLLNKELSVHPDSAIFVRQDEEQMDTMRALITGPADTPYSRGCFVFDVYFPQQYPNVPPLVKLITTGNGHVRFNPNLYADGKVCLSLLGTWHSGDSSQKWQAGQSTLYQVLMSIQSLILIEEPMFNEPGYEGMKGTDEGQAKSQEYNTRLQIHTIRHAMLGQLMNPPVGFASAIQAHFSLQRDTIMKQCAAWLRDCSSAEDERRMRQAIEELLQAMNTLPDIHTILSEEQDDDEEE